MESVTQELNMQNHSTRSLKVNGMKILPTEIPHDGQECLETGRSARKEKEPM